MKKLVLCIICVLAGMFFKLEYLPAEETVVLETVVVTATRTPVDINKTTGSVSVLGNNEFSIYNDFELQKILRGNVGVDVVQIGGFGRVSSAFLRGANPGHTLVLFNGNRINSPLTGIYDFADILIDDVYQIEIVRGPLSSLYGSDAVGGVINIIPKQGVGAFKAELSVEGGSYTTFHEHIALSQGLDNADYYLSISRVDSDGIGDDDDYNNTYLALNTGWTPVEKVDLRFITHYGISNVGIDDYDGPSYTVINDPNSTQEKKLFLISGIGEYSANEWLKSSVALSVYKEDLLLEDADNPGDPFLNNAEFNSTTVSIDWQNDLLILDNDTVTVGIEYDNYHGKNVGLYDETVYNTGVYVNNQWEITEVLKNVAGIRIDNHQMFGNHTTARIGLNWDIPEYVMTLYGNVGSAFKAPNMNDLYFPGFGDTDLRPEKSVGAEIGVKKTFFNDKLDIVINGYYNDFDDLIGTETTTDPAYEFGMKSANIDSAESIGIEFLTRYTPIESLILVLSYTLDKTENKATGAELVRRPENKCMVSAEWNPIEKLFIAAQARYTGKRLDVGDVQLDEYVTVDVSIRYFIKENIECYLRGENIFDEEYEEAAGYEAPGSALYGGVKIDL